MEIPGNPELLMVAISEEIESALRPEPNTLEFMVYQGSYFASELTEERDFYKQLYISVLDKQERDMPYVDFGRHAQDFVRFCFEGLGEGSSHAPSTISITGENEIRMTKEELDKLISDQVTRALANRTSTSTPPPPSQTVIHKDSGLKAFQSCNPPEFTWILGAIDAQEWLSRMKTIFQTYNCVPEERLVIA
ncbi:hypothetical protein L1987_39870 [Smallanthus sonchifolius]|uniref:Uncharacterized protein n=1 Tax=Smallanthus sonchifolius TaxID=185202 RepID=A0ACB9GSU8_9ASTR|nr:hypothetical protein L1987_39870 [Smallanthus sonchifolius]